MEQLTGSELSKEYNTAAHCHPAYLTCMQSTSYEMPGWMNHKLKSTLLGEISTTSRYADIITLMAESEEELKSLLKVKEENERASLILNIKKQNKTKIMASGPITSWQIEGEKVK